LTASVWSSDTAAKQSRFKKRSKAEYSRLADYFRNIIAAIFLSRSPIKDAIVVGF
jgi:dsRNA-specific ribonuclease